MKNKIQIIFFLLTVVVASFFAMVASVSAENNNISLPKTGQTKCYGTVGDEIPCAGTGQDGDIQAGADWPGVRFYDNGDGAQTDNLTGLMWAKDASTPAVDSCAGGMKAWQGALDYVECLNGHAYLGYSDWRLPNINELDSLVNLQGTDPAGWLNDNGFISVQFGYWSSTSRTMPGTDSAWYSFIDSSFHSSGKLNAYYAWPVRAGQFGLTDSNYPANVPKTGQKESFYPSDDGDIQAGAEWPSGRLEDTGDETVTDNLTGLIWAKDVSTPVVGECRFENMTWQRALDHIQCLNSNSYLGYSDWRLPNKKELDSLVDFSQYGPALPIDNPFINFRPYEGYHYISSSSYVEDKRFFYYKNYDEGSEGGSWKDNRFGMKFLVWPVRGGITQALDPVVIIPGIMGSWEVNGKWEIDPILLSYENLKKALDNNGYTPGGDMFNFPYQWRNSNVNNAILLRDAINKVKEKTKRSKVDLVAHSMGGLLAREYIESDYYQNDVDQLITLGTPHAGAPKAYMMWEAGESDSYLEDKVLEIIFNREAKKAGYKNLFYYIHDKIPSLRELLPVYDYIFDLDSKTFRTYPEEYPRNSFLSSLNSDEKISQLHKVEFKNIYGKTNKKNTISGYNVINAPAFGDYWKDGYPKDFNLPWSSEGFIYDTGDGTVPEKSAKYLKEGYNIEIDTSHSKIPTEAQQDVVELLTGKRPINKIISEGLEIKKILLVQVYCPIDLQVISPSGDIIGKNFKTGGEINEIYRATYINNSEDEEFIAIPNPEYGEYKILTKGTGIGGTYEVDVTKIEEDEADLSNFREITGTIRGITQPGEIIETKVDIESNKVIAVNIQTIRKNVEHYAAIGYISSIGELNYYLARFDLLEELINQLNSDERNKKSLKNIKNEINMHIDHLIKHTRKSIPIKIDKKAADFLIEDLNDLKI